MSKKFQELLKAAKAAKSVKVMVSVPEEDGPGHTKGLVTLAELAEMMPCCGGGKCDKKATPPKKKGRPKKEKNEESPE